LGLSTEHLFGVSDPTTVLSFTVSMVFIDRYISLEMSFGYGDSFSQGEEVGVKAWPAVTFLSFCTMVVHACVDSRLS
jgi:hypothetical protein